MTSHKPSSGSGSRRSPATGATSTSLLQRVRTRDLDAWQRLADLYTPLVYSWCRRADLSAEDAADVLQEVFKAVSQAINGFRYDRPGDTFRGWLRTITRNKIRDHFRHRARHPQAIGGSSAQQRFTEVATEESETSAGTAPLGDLFRRALEPIRAEFEDRTWQAFWMVTVEEQRPADVAERLGMSRGAVAQAKYRVLQRLRRELGDDD